MSAPERAAPLASWEDLARLPDHVRAEIIEGVLVEKDAAAFEHSQTQRAIGARLDPFVRRPGGGNPGGWWIGTEVLVLYERREVYVHDAAGWRRERVPEAPRGRPTLVRPDWVCEILSPSNWAHDTVAKFHTLQRHQVPHYWVVDPERSILTVYRFGTQVYEVAAVATPGQRLRLEPFEALELEVAVLFGADPTDDG